MIIISGIFSFFFSSKAFKNYYTEERKSDIIFKYNKPGYIRYAILVLFSFGSLFLMIICAILAGIIYNNWITN